MTLSKREKLGIMFALVVIGLVLFFTVGRSKENYRNINTYWEDKAFRLPFDSIEEKEEAYLKVLEAQNQKKKYQQVRYNLLVALIRKATAQGKSKKVKKLKDKLKKLKKKKNED